MKISAHPDRFHDIPTDIIIKEIVYIVETLERAEKILHFKDGNIHSKHHYNYLRTPSKLHINTIQSIAMTPICMHISKLTPKNNPCDNCPWDSLTCNREVYNDILNPLSDLYWNKDEFLYPEWEKNLVAVLGILRTVLKTRFSAKTPKK